MVTRRQILATSGLLASAAALPSAMLSASASPDWMLGVGDILSDVAPRRLVRLHGQAPNLQGTLYRNGPGRFRRGTSAAGHWFDGDGLIRAFRVHGNDARLAARFVDTPKRRLEARLGRIVQPGFGTSPRVGAEVESVDDTNAANTNVIKAGNRLLALWEAGSAVAVDPKTLDTKGVVTFRDDLAHMPFLAHPRIEPDGRIWNLGWGGETAFVWQLAANGDIKAGQAIKLPQASYFHDFTATARHLVIVLQPWINEGSRLPFSAGMDWRPDRGTKVVVIDKADLSRQRVYELPTFFFFHLGDAWEETDGTIRFDGCFHADNTFVDKVAPALLDGHIVHSVPPRLTMVTLRPDGRSDMSDAGVVAEFPRSAPELAGLKRSQTIYVGGYASDRPFARSVGIWDWATGKADSFDFGPQHLAEEFVPAGRWLIGTTLNLVAKATELHMFDQGRVSDGPVVSWRGDVALPIGFHGSWVS